MAANNGIKSKAVGNKYQAIDTNNDQKIACEIDVFRFVETKDGDDEVKALRENEIGNSHT